MASWPSGRKLSLSTYAPLFLRLSDRRNCVVLNPPLGLYLQRVSYINTGFLWLGRAIYDFVSFSFSVVVAVPWFGRAKALQKADRKSVV